MALPPELMAMLQGGGASAAAPAGPPPGLEGLAGPPPGDPLGQPPLPGGEGGQSTLDVLNEMIELAKLYIELDEDEEDKLTMSKVLSTLQKYLADEQREGQNAMQGNLSPRIMSRAYGG